MLLRARVSVSCTDPGALAGGAVPIRWGVPLQEVARRTKVLYERVAGIDVHKDMIKVAIRSRGRSRGPARPRSWSTGRFTGCSSRWPASCVSGA